MAVDMTNLTTAQYRQRIEEMSIKEIQKEIEFLESPGSKAIIYYVSDEVHEDKEAAKEFLKSRREAKKG